MDPNARSVLLLTLHVVLLEVAAESHTLGVVLGQDVLLLTFGVSVLDLEPALEDAAGGALDAASTARLRAVYSQIEGFAGIDAQVNTGVARLTGFSLEELEERVHILNGRLSVESRSEGGTAVRVILPQYVAEAQG